MQSPYSLTTFCDPLLLCSSPWLYLYVPSQFTVAHIASLVVLCCMGIVYSSSCPCCHIYVELIHSHLILLRSPLHLRLVLYVFSISMTCLQCTN